MVDMEKVEFCQGAPLFDHVDDEDKGQRHDRCEPRGWGQARDELRERERRERGP